MTSAQNVITERLKEALDELLTEQDYVGARMCVDLIELIQRMKETK